MRLSITAIFVFICIVIFSIFVANLADLVSTEEKRKNLINNKHDNGINFYYNQEKLRIKNESDHLMWFMQISDLHISIFKDPTIIKEFKEFVNNTIDYIKPNVVLASGDLTDARDDNKLGSKQYLKEWQIYRKILEDGNINNRTVWLDIRGNHDYFNVPDINSNLNYFNRYSMQGGKHKRSYLKQISVGDDIYSFIAVDACLEPGPKRPYNFIGLLQKNETERLVQLSEESRKNGGNYTIWFGHYPTSCIISPGSGNENIREVIGKYEESYVYLCGHLHTQGGLIPHMYTQQKAGFLELELGDWKDNRLFRIGAFDHGLFSFIDVRHNDWPIVLVTNPKQSLLNIPNKENPKLQKDSTHIRLLIFSPTPVTVCRINIENDGWTECKQVTDNLFVIPWSTTKYNKGIHSMNIIVKTNDSIKEIRHTFSLDGSRQEFGLMAKFILMSNLCVFFQIIFGIALASCFVPLCIFRILHELTKRNKISKPNFKSSVIGEVVRKFWILSSVNRLFIPIVLYCVYITIGPWAFIDVIDGHLGVIFVWGIYVNNSFLPGSLTYIYGCFQLFFCQFPLTIVYANAANRRFNSICGLTNSSACSTHFPFVVIIFMEVILAVVFWWAYGTLAFILGAFRTWTLVFHIVMWYMSNHIPEKCLMSSITIWQERVSVLNN